MLVEIQLIKGGIQSFGTILLATLLHEGGFAYTSGSFYHDESVVPCYLFIQITMERSIKAFCQTI